MSAWFKELIPVLVMYLAGTVTAGIYLYHSMSEWFATKPAGGYLGYSLGWYLWTPIQFMLGWYGAIILVIVTINVWAYLKG